MSERRVETGVHAAMVWLVLAMGADAAAAFAPPDLKGSEEEQLRRALSDRGMPELLEAAGPPKTAAAREAIAAAYALEGSRCTDPARRAALLSRAEQSYRELIATRTASTNLGEQDRFEVARWRVACAEIIARYSLAGDLDRFEITSGLAAPRERIARRLDEALEQYAGGEALLAALTAAMKQNEERFLLLGLREPVARLARECALNAGWARVWRAAAAERIGDRTRPLAQALRSFDVLTANQSSAGTEQRHSAWIGTAVALRLSQRFDESLRALERVDGDHPGYVTTVQAQYERGRTLIAAGRFADGRAALGRLAAVRTDQLAPEHAAARFYILLAPVLIADSYFLQAQAAGTSAAAGAGFRRQGTDDMSKLVVRGGEWIEIVDTYLNARGALRDPSQRSSAELILNAQRAMHDQKYADAEPLWRAALAKLSASDAARVDATYNLAVCLFQTDHPKEAADRFLELARKGPSEPLAERAAYFAYRCRAQTAQASRQPDDYIALAEAGQVLLATFPSHPEAEQISWIIPVALQEAGRYSDAAAAYRSIPAGAKRFWEAQHNAMTCRQAEMESRVASGTAGSSRAEAAKAATDIARDWRKLAAAIRDAARHGDARVQESAGRDAELAAAELLAGESAGRYREALAVLDAVTAEEGVSPEQRGHILSIRIRCHRGLGQFEKAAAALDEYVKTVPPDKVGGVLIGLAAGMEAEIERLVAAQRPAEAKRVAVAAVPTLRQLLAWIDRQPTRAAEVPTVRLSLVKVLDRAGESREALEQLDRLMASAPENGAFLRMAAVLNEQTARRDIGERRSAGLAKAQEYWARLLADASLRDTSPGVYWEARYRWLSLRLDEGHAAEVARGIDAERAWFPNLGGPPWQGKLLELADEARRRAGPELQP